MCIERDLCQLIRLLREKFKMGEKEEALVVCSDKSMKIGVTIWDVKNGDQLLRIPTCAASPHGFLCLKNQYLVSSQFNRYGSLGGGTISMWALNKQPQPPLQSYTMEAIGPISCTKDAMYLVGGALSGNAYLWEVANGRLHYEWHAHNKALKCMVFSDDDSLLISGSDDGQICIWSMINLLEMEDSRRSPPLLLYSFDHKSSITGLQTLPGLRRSIFVSSSLDATSKVWDFSGRLLQTQVYPLAVTAIVLNAAEQEQLLFAGSADGRIFINTLDIGVVEDPFLVVAHQPIELKGHNGSITALTMSASGLISASEDRTVCLWDVPKRVIVRRFDHEKGAVTNLVVIPKSLLPPESHNQKAPNQLRVSLLDKFTQPNLPKRMIALLHSCSSTKNEKLSIFVQRAESLIHQYMSELQQEGSPATMQLKMEISTNYRKLATNMTKHVNEMNKHLQSRLLDLMRYRVQWCKRIDSAASTTNKKKLKMTC